MRGADVDVARAHLLELVDGPDEGAARVDHVVVDDAGLVLDVADDAHDLGRIVPRATLVSDGDLAAEVVGELLGDLRAAHVGGDDDRLVPVEVLGLEVLAEQVERGQVRDGDVEESLDLVGVQVERDHAVDAGGLEEVGDETRGDGLARGGLAVLARVAVVGDDGGEARRGRPGGGIGDDEGLHEEVVHVRAGERLDEEHLAAADGLLEACVRLTIGELLEHEAREGKVKDVCDTLCESGVSGASVEPDVLLDVERFAKILVHLSSPLSRAASSTPLPSCQLSSACCARGRARPRGRRA